jgi:hypothetical protein
MSTRLIRFTMDLSPKEHKRLSTVASLLGLSKKDLVLASIDKFTHTKLNKTTEATLKSTNAGKGLHKFDTLEDMFKDLGI